MGYSDPRWLLHPQEVPGYSINESDLPYLSLNDDYQVLERLLQLNEEALYQMTLHRFASVLQLSHHGPGENPSCIDRPLLDRRPRVSRSPSVRICPLRIGENSLWYHIADELKSRCATRGIVHETIGTPGDHERIWWPEVVFESSGSGQEDQGEVFVALWQVFENFVRYTQASILTQQRNDLLIPARRSFLRNVQASLQQEQARS
jgi:hypothetical protein